MASRNLTDKYSEFRAARQRRPSAGSAGDAGGAGLLSADDGKVGEGWQDVRNMLPPAWVDTVEEIEADMAEMDKKMDTMIGLHTKRLMVTFDDSSERDQDREIDALAQSITALFRRCERTLKRIQGSANDTGSEQKIRGNVVRTLAQRLQGVNVKFRRAQKEYLSKRQAQKTGATADGTFDFLSETEKGSGAPQLTSLDTAGVQFTMDQLAVVDDAEKLAAERDQEINKIVQNIEELSAIFKELAVLVIDQGTILDRIDYNMEQVVQSTEDGVIALEKAEAYQKSARPRWCICILLFLITILLTFLILKHNGTINEDDGNSKKSNDDIVDSATRRLMYVMFPDVDGGELSLD